MKLPDVNLLLYAVDESSPRFEPAHRWAQDMFGGIETVALPWAVAPAFVRLTTKATIMANPIAVDEALDLVDGWLARPNVVVVGPTNRHAVVLRELLGPLGNGGNLVSDAHLAALAIEHGAELSSAAQAASRSRALGGMAQARQQPALAPQCPRCALVAAAVGPQQLHDAATGALVRRGVVDVEHVAVRWRWPPERRRPRWPTDVS